MFALRLFSYFLGVLLVVTTIAPRVISWNFLKPTLEKEMVSSLGTPVKIKGDIHLTALPLISASVENIEIVEKKSPTGNTLIKGKVKEVELTLNPLTLLFFTIAPDVRVVGLEGMMDSAFLDTLPKSKEDKKAAAEAAKKAKAEGEKTIYQQLTDIREKVPLLSRAQLYLDLIDVNFVYKDKASETALQDMDLHLEINDILGPYSIEATLSKSGTPTSVEVSLADLNAATPSSFSLELAQGTLRADAGGTVSLGKNIAVKADFKGGWDALPGKGKKVQSLPVTFRGKLDATPDVVKGEVTELKFGKSVGTGKINLTLSPTMKGQVSFKKLPGDTSLEFELLPSKSVSRGDLTFKSARLQSFLAALPGSPSVLTEDQSAEISAKAVYNPKSKKLNLDRFKIEIGKAQVTGDVDLDLSKGMRIIYNLSIPSGGQWAHLFNAEHKPAHPGKLHLKGDATSAGGGYDINATLNLYPGSVRIDGLYGGHPNPLNLSLTFKTDDLGATLTSITGDNGGQAGPVEIKTKVVGSPKKFDLKETSFDLDITAVNTEGKSDLSLDMTKAKPDVQGSVTIEKLSFGGGKAAAKTSKASNDNEKKSDAKEAKSSPKDLPNMIKAIPVTGKVTLKGPTVAKAEGLEIKGLQAVLALGSDLVHIQSIGGTIGKGTLSGSGKLFASQPGNYLKLQGKDLPLGDIVSKLSGQELLTGIPTNVNIDLKSPKGHHPLAFMEHGSGVIKIDGGKGTVSSPKVVAICPLINLAGSKNLLPGGSNDKKNIGNICSGEPSTLDSLNVDMKLTKGKGVLSKAQAKSSFADVDFKGDVDFVKKAVNMTGEYNVKLIKNLPPVPAKLHGPFDNLTHEMDTAGLAMKLAGSQIAGQLGLDLSGDNPGELLSGSLSKFAGKGVPGLGAITGIFSGDGDAKGAVGDIIGNAVGGPVGGAIISGIFGAITGGSKKGDNDNKEEEKKDASEKK